MTQGFVEVRTVDQLWPLLYAPVLVTALILLVVFGFAAPRLDLEAATPRFSWSRSRGKEGAA
jgi:hypothetical protein